MCGAFDLLNETFVRVMIMFVGFIFLAPYPTIAKKLPHTPHKLFLCIIRLDFDWGVTLVEPVLKDLGNVKA